jgi:hypothetical protein
MKPTFVALLATAVLAASGVANAQSGGASSNLLKQLEARFASADTDHDGKLTKAEAAAGMPRVAAHFDEIDTAHAGTITLAQIEQFLAQRKQ